MEVYVLSSQKGVIGVYPTLNAAKTSVEIMVWTSPEDKVFEAREDWGKHQVIYTIRQMKMRA